MVHPGNCDRVPSEITQVEKRAGDGLGLPRQGERGPLVEQAMVAAIGAGLPITEPGGNM